jgi:hemoglobin/transferrin/lactoferrin receptor protein
MKLFFISTLVLYSSLLFPQTVTVIDKTTRQPIPGVVIYSSDLTVSLTTDARGEAGIYKLMGADNIFFRQMGYKTEIFGYPQLESAKFSVELTQTVISLNEVVVSVNRWTEQMIEIPGKVEKLNLRDVSFSNPQTSADLLASSGYVYIQKSQQSGGSPAIRGFATNRILLAVDGVRINNAIFRTGNLQNVVSIDASSLESTEVIFGPGSVMYGSDAIGGVMSFHTLQPLFADSLANSRISGNGFMRYASANSEKTGHVDLNLGFKKIGFVTAFTYSDFDDLRTGSHGNSYFLRHVYQETIDGVDYQVENTDPALQISSGYNQMNLLQKVVFRPAKSWNLEYGFYYSTTSDVPRYDRLCLDSDGDGNLDYAQWYYGPQKWMMNRLEVTNTQSNIYYDQVRFTAAWQSYGESRHDRKFGNSKLRNQIESVEALSLNLDLIKNIGDRVTLYYGAEAVSNSVGSVADRVNIFSGASEPTSTRYPDGSKWKAYGVYSNLKYTISPNWKLNTGLRYSHYSINADFDTTMFPFPFTHAENRNGAVSGSAGFVFTPVKTWQIYFNLSTGFRAPNIDDIGKVFSSEPGSVVVPNDALKPEYAYNAETGFTGTFDKLKIDLAVYYTLLDHALARRDFTYNGRDSIEYDGEMSRVQAIRNISKAYVYGFQAGVDINFGKGFAFKTTLSYQKGQEQSEDSLINYPLSHLAPFFGSTHLTYERKKLRLDFYASYNSKMDFEELPLSERNDDSPYAKNEEGLPFVPGWYTLNFKAGLYLDKHLSLNCGVENITDCRYRPFGSGISAPGRNFFAVLRCTF